MDEIEHNVIAVIARSTEVPVEAIDLSSSIKDLAIDSMQQLHLLFTIESTFRIRISDEEAMRLDCVRSVVSVVRARLAADRTRGATRA